MEELIKTFHIDIKLIIAQLVNFGIVLLVLKKYAYGPVLKMMQERTDKIEKGMADAESAGKKILEIAEKEKEIVTKAEEIAKKNKEEIIIEAKNQSEKILSDSAKKIEQEKNQMMQEVKGQIAELVIAATGKVLNEKIDGEKDAQLIKNAIEK